MVCLSYNLLSTQSDICFHYLYEINSLLFDLSAVVLTGMKNTQRSLHSLKIKTRGPHPEHSSLPEILSAVQHNACS